MNSQIFLTIVVGILCILSGYLIRFKKMVRLWPGYNEEKIADVDGFARWTGTNIIIIGLLLLIAGLLRAFAKDIAQTLVLQAFVFLVFVFIVIAFYGSKRFEKKLR